MTMQIIQIPILSKIPPNYMRTLDPCDPAQPHANDIWFGKYIRKITQPLLFFLFFYRMVHSVMHNMPDIIYGNWKPISSPPKPIYPSQGNKSKIIIRI